MGKLLSILTAIIVLGVILVFGQELFFPTGTRSGEQSAPRTLADDNRVAVTHAWQDGIHRYTGTFLLPHSCFSVAQAGMYRGDSIDIAFDVKDRLLEEKTCLKITTRYPFTIIIEAPQDVPAQFRLNGEEVPSKIRELDWQSSIGNFIDTSVTSPTFR